MRRPRKIDPVVTKQSVSGERVFGDDPLRLYGLYDLQAILIPNFKVSVKGQKYIQTKGLIIVQMSRFTLRWQKRSSIWIALARRIAGYQILGS